MGVSGSLQAPCGVPVPNRRSKLRPEPVREPVKWDGSEFPHRFRAVSPVYIPLLMAVECPPRSAPMGSPVRRPPWFRSRLSPFQKPVRGQAVGTKRSVARQEMDCRKYRPKENRVRCIAIPPRNRTVPNRDGRLTGNDEMAPPSISPVLKLRHHAAEKALPSFWAAFHCVNWSCRAALRRV